MIEVLICYAILGDRLSTPILIAPDFAHKEIVTALEFEHDGVESYICSQKPIDFKAKLYTKQRKTVREKSKSWPKGYRPYDSL